MRITIQAGPDAGRSILLAEGRYLLGRGRSGDTTDGLINIDDDEIEAHHLVVQVETNQSCRLVQLAGRAPMVVDGKPMPSTTVGRGEIVELGASRLRMGSRPMDHRPDESGRFVVLAGAARAEYLARSDRPGTVLLGYGEVRLPIPVDIGLLPIEQQPAAAAAEVHEGLPILADMSAARVVAIRGHGADRVATAIAAQLGSRNMMASGCRPDRRRRSASGPLLVVIAAGGQLPRGCDSLLDLGARWRATWHADLTSDALPLRLHVAGRRPATRPLLVGRQPNRRMIGQFTAPLARPQQLPALPWGRSSAVRPRIGCAPASGRSIRQTATTANSVGRTPVDPRSRGSPSQHWGSALRQGRSSERR